MLMLFAPDGGQDLSVRLARLLGEGSSTIWAGYGSARKSYGVAAVGPLARNAQPTPVARDDAAFEAGAPWRSRFQRTGRTGARMVGEASMSGRLFPSADPPLGEGSLAARIEMSFRALHTPVTVRPGRMEVFGLGRGRLVLPDHEIGFSGYAKWHEQVGERPSFAPAFTYVALTGGETALLAVTRGDSANGIALEHGKTTAVTALRISPPAPEREFEASLTDGRKIGGSARTLRTSSEPIEGKRRPSATVAAETALGPMVGQINDWKPGT